MSNRNNTNTDVTGSGVDRFTELIDCPSTYAGSANKYVTVNSGQTGLTFVAGGGGGGDTEFIQGTDTPMTYAGTNLYDIVNINNAHNGVQFTSLPLIAKANLPLTGLSDYQQTGYAPTGGYLTSTGSGWVVTPAPVPPTGGNDIYVLDTYTNRVTLGSYAINTYLLDLNYIVSNEGFGITLPNNFSPSLTTKFNINWEFRLSIYNSGSFGSNGPSLTIDLILPSGTVVQNLITKTYPYNTIPINTEAYFTESGLVQDLELNAGSNYQIRYRIANANVLIYYSKYNKSIEIDGTAPFYLEQANDYLTFGYGTSGQSLISNGVNGFTLQSLPNKIETQTDYLASGYGANGQSLVSNGVNGFTLQSLPNKIETQTDYLTSGYGTSGQVLTSNGTDGFILTTPTTVDTKLIELTDCPNNYGSPGNVLTSNGSAVIWSPAPSVTFPSGNFSLTFLDSAYFDNLFVGIPFYYQIMGNAVLLKLDYGGQVTSISTLRSNQSYLQSSTNIPSEITPTFTQLAPWVFSIPPTYTWSNTGGTIYIEPGGILSFRSLQFQYTQYWGLNGVGQVVTMADQTFMYFLN